MNISIFGLGYVGCVAAACLARDGHRVIGVDVNPEKVDLIRKGVSPIVEKDLGFLVEAAVRKGSLTATTDSRAAVADTVISLVCVGTPSLASGNLDLSHVRNVCEQIGQALAEKDRYHVVALRSTMLPGTMRAVVLPVLAEHAGREAGESYGVCVNPEFLREGSAVWDYDNPPKTVLGSDDPRAASLVGALYKSFDAPLFDVDLDTAEMVKYADNAWHALKVTFANEIGNICKAVGVDSHRVMQIFCSDTKLNLSAYYLRPGFAFGGSCLPKDLRALTYKARALDLETPVLNAVLPSNALQIARAINMVLATGRRRVGVLGFSFKAGTDDLRESPQVALIETLLGKGYEMRLYDRNITLAALKGANRDYILNHIPHISRLMLPSLDELLDFAEVVVVGNDSEEFKEVAHRLREEQLMIDLVRVQSHQTIAGRYEGLCW